MQFAFTVYLIRGLPKSIWNECADNLLLTDKKLLRKIKRGLELASLSYFLHDFWRKLFLTLHSINWPNFFRWNFLDNMCIVNIYFLVNDVIYFEINLTFFIKRFSYVNNKSMNKNSIILRTKRAFKMKWKAFLSSSKGFH